jgi:ubiquinone/menaquinone biosynthesis C-methylase UbiE
MNNRKLLLAYLRNGNYAHAGEAEAIELAMSRIPKKTDQLLLDIGCGLGGTAEYLEKHAWGKVTGVDIDPEMITYAQQHCPSIHFQRCDALHLDRVFTRPTFDILYSFNAFFSFPSQETCLKQMATVAKNNAALMLFDYSSPTSFIRENIFLDHFSPTPKIFMPINMVHIKTMLSNAGWYLEDSINITNKFEAWYQWLVKKMVDQKTDLVQRFSEHTFEDLYSGYSQLLDLIQSAQVGGVIIYARRRE